jgi:hypothetical protein
VQTVSGLAKSEAEAADGPGRGQDLTDSEVWKRYYERAADLCQPRWDAVVVDEAQDMLFEAWYLIERLAHGRRLWAFQDPGQRFWADRAPPEGLFPPPFKLTRGKRSPPGIEALGQRCLGLPADEAAIKQALRDGILVPVPCPDPFRTAERVGEEIDRILSEKVALADIGVVSLRGQVAREAVHHAARLGRHEFVDAGADGMEERLVADTFMHWKGLERPVIVVADLPGGELGQLGVRLNVALTRATVAPRVVGPPAALERLGLT